MIDPYLLGFSAIICYSFNLCLWLIFMITSSTSDLLLDQSYALNWLILTLCLHFKSSSSPFNLSRPTTLITLFIIFWTIRLCTFLYFSLKTRSSSLIPIPSSSSSSSSSSSYSISDPRMIRMKNDSKSSYNGKRLFFYLFIYQSLTVYVNSLCLPFLFSSPSLDISITDSSAIIFMIFFALAFVFALFVSYLDSQKLNRLHAVSSFAKTQKQGREDKEGEDSSSIFYYIAPNTSIWMRSRHANYFMENLSWWSIAIFTFYHMALDSLSIGLFIVAFLGPGHMQLANLYFSGIISPNPIEDGHKEYKTLVQESFTSNHLELEDDESTYSAYLKWISSTSAYLPIKSKAREGEGEGEGGGKGKNLTRLRVGWGLGMNQTALGYWH